MGHTQSCKEITVKLWFICLSLAGFSQEKIDLTSTTFNSGKKKNNRIHATFALFRFPQQRNRSFADDSSITAKARLCPRLDFPLKSFISNCILSRTL